MASKLLLKAVTKADIKEYLNDFADFSFELKVLKELTDLKLQCQHGGTYDDPITGKSREFDIRALLQDEKPYRVHLSVECKNLHPNYPLIMHSLCRKQNEAYNEWIYTFDPTKKYGPAAPISLFAPAKKVRVSSYSLYSSGSHVAKSADQVGRRVDQTLTATDGGVFEKMSQALNSASDLISQAVDLSTGKNDYYTFVCPVLIVPDLTLWQVKYKDDGGLDGDAEQINHISYFIGKEWTVNEGTLKSFTYSLSHLEVLTFSEIKTFVTKYLWNYLTRCVSAIEKDALS
jgi:hypothetical protein